MSFRSGDVVSGGAGGRVEGEVHGELGAEPRAVRARAEAELAERAGDAVMALRLFENGLQEEPSDVETLYALLAGAARCLNLASRHHEAEAYCREAIALASCRPEAYEALGVSCEGRALLFDAARCYVLAAIAEPGGGEGMARLELLLRSHPEIEREHPEIAKHRRYCREAADRVRRLSLNGRGS
jgi:tetratricopeptide (TPR) repeat protein